MKKSLKGRQSKIYIRVIKRIKRATIAIIGIQSWKMSWRKNCNRLRHNWNQRLARKTGWRPSSKSSKISIIPLRNKSRLLSRKIRNFKLKLGRKSLKLLVLLILQNNLKSSMKSWKRNHSKYQSLSHNCERPKAI